MAIYRVGDNYVISSKDVWLPGNYDSRGTATWAFQFPDAVLSELEKEINQGQQRPITRADLEARVITL